MNDRVSDEILMEVFFKKMLQKMARSAAAGRSGWETLTREQLSTMLREHVEKGDPVDVANFCFMLAAKGFGIAPAPARHGRSLNDHRHRAERTAMVSAIALHQGNISRAARDLNISRPTLYRLMNQHGIRKPHGAGDE